MKTKSIFIAVLAVVFILAGCKKEILVTGVEVSDDLVKLYSVGATKQLTAEITPEDATDKNVTWESSNNSVATVDPEGLVTAKGAGRCIITVTTNDGGLQSNCVLEVDLTTYVTGISLNKTNLTLNGPLGTKETLVATIAPPNADNLTYTWSTSNPAVAQVSETGEVVSIYPGTCTITATTEYTTGGGVHTATCEVTVLVPYEEISMKTSTYLLTGAEQTLVVSFEPSYATNKEMEWKSSDESVATVDAAGVIKGIAGGSATITAKNKDTGEELICEVGVLGQGYVKEITFEDGTSGITGRVNNGWKLDGDVQIGNGRTAYGGNDRDALQVVDFNGIPALWLNFVFPSEVGRQWATYRFSFPSAIVPIVAVATKLEFDFWIAENTINGSGGDYDYGSYQWDLIHGSTSDEGFRLKPDPTNGELKPSFIKANSELIGTYYKYHLVIDLTDPAQFTNNKAFADKPGLTRFAFQFGQWGVWVEDPVYLTNIKIIIE
mgnify:CR=1 FL=1|jgi:uncharacterized protein YjdB